MIFPMTAGSDPDYFISISKACINTFPDLCVDGTRPVGIIYYYSMLLSLFKDEVTFNYVVLCLNITYIFMTFIILNKIMNKEKSIVLSFTIFFIVLFNMICFAPFTMSDPIAILFFFIGMYILLNKVDFNSLLNRDNILFFIAGLSFAIACLFKQNYGVFGIIVTIVVFSYNIYIKGMSIVVAKKLIFFMLGFSLILIQLVAIYYAYKKIGLFVPFPIPNYQPYVQSFGYTNIINSINDLVPGFYFTVLDSYINPIIYYFYKIYLGLSNVALTLCYVDRPSISNIIHLDYEVYFQMFLMFGFLSVILVYSIKENNYINIVFLLSSILIAIFIAVTFHVENRYYVIPRMLIYIVVSSIVFKRILKK